MSIVESSREFRAVNTSDLYDYVDSDGVLHINEPFHPVQVRSSSDLSMPELTAYPVGTFAYTAGWKSVWQKKSDGTWESV